MTLPHRTFYTPLGHIGDFIEATGAGDKDVGFLPSYSRPHIATTRSGCSEMMQISIIVRWINLFASMLVHMFLAVMVRQYAKSLWTTQTDYVRLNDAALEEGCLDDKTAASIKGR